MKNVLLEELVNLILCVLKNLNKFYKTLPFLQFPFFFSFFFKYLAKNWFLKKYLPNLILYL